MNNSEHWKHSLKRLTLVLLLALFAVVFCVPVEEATAATISGTLYQSDGVTPVAGKYISVFAESGSQCSTRYFVGSAYADSATGTYTITGLPSGTYYLRTALSDFDNYFDEWWASPQSVRDCAGAQPIEVTEGQTVNGKDFQLDPGATISGTVYQSDGVTPVTGANIEVYAYTGSPCGSLTYAKDGYLDQSTGTYTIAGLPAGTYYLRTRLYSSGNYLDEWWASPQSVRDCGGAQPIEVTEVQAVTGKDFQLDPGATISGTVYQSDGVTPLTGKYIAVGTYTGSPCVINTQVGLTLVDSATGTYTITGLPTGTYYLQTKPSDNYIWEWWASPQSVRDCSGAQPIVVTEGQDVTGKDFQLDPGATISGTVYQSDGVTPLTGKYIAVGTYTGSPCVINTQVGYTPVDSATGTYTISRVPAGTYYLRTYSYSPGNYLDECWASPQSVQDCTGAQPIVVTDGQVAAGKDFQLDPGLTISGTVYQSDGVTPLTGKHISVYAYTGSPCGGYTNVRSAGVNSETGTYTITGLPAGTYFLKASSALDLGNNYISEWWASPQSVQDCAGAQPIEVTQDQAVNGKDFQLDPGATISGTVYQSDGVTPLTGEYIKVGAYTGSPCGIDTQVGYTDITGFDSATGTYTITGLPSGTYYLRTFSPTEYISEWWASPQSVRDCASAQPIMVTNGQATTGKDFQLDPGGSTISGTVYQSDGVTPLTTWFVTGISVRPYTGSTCDSYTQVASGVYWFGTTGTYTLTGLPAGTYFLKASSVLDFAGYYLDEWWASPQSVRDCASAQPIVVTEGQVVTGYDFQLDPAGSLTVTISPQGAIDAGAQWRRVGTATWLDSGTTENSIPVGTYTVEFKTVTGWTAPSSVGVTISIGQTETTSGTYIQQVGTVVINPDPNSINAPWTLTGPYSYSQSGTGYQTLSNLPIGDYTIAWGDVAGWTKPAGETKAVTNGGTTTFTGTYVQQTNPIIQVTPSSLSFGYVPVGSPKPKDLTLTVKNAGGGTLTGNATTTDPFSIVSGGSYSLGAGESRVVTVRYQPTVQGKHTGIVSFTGGNGATIPLTGKTEKSLGLPWLQLLLGN